MWGWPRGATRRLGSRRPGAPSALQQEGDRGGPVGHGVVHLRHDSEPIVGQALDHDDLPQRPVPGQGPARHVGHHGGQLAVTPRLGDPATGDVPSQVEVGVLDPHRVPEPQGTGTARRRNGGSRSRRRPNSSSICS